MHIRGLRLAAFACLLTALSLTLSACGGLGGEPAVVATIPPTMLRPTIDPTQLAEAATAHAQATVQTTPGTPAQVGTEDAAAAIVEATADATRDAAPARVGTVTGKVTNRTAGVALPAALKVDLHIIDAAAKETILNAVVAPDGTFRFEGVTFVSDSRYFASTMYLDRRFDSELRTGDQATGDPAALDLPLEIAEFTSDPAVLAINSLVMQTVYDSSGLQVMQIVRLTNTSDRVFVTDEKLGDNLFVSVRLPLPEGAVVLSTPNSTDRFGMSPDGKALVDTAPVLPGASHLIHVLYTLPFDGQRREFTQTLPYKMAGSIRVLAFPQRLNATFNVGGAALASQGTQDIGGNVYTLFGGEVSTASDTPIRYALEVPAPSPLDSLSTMLSGGQVVAVALTALGSLLVIAGVVMLVRNSRQASALVKAAAPASAAHQHEIDTLVAEIAQLDDRHAKKQIKDAEYKVKRAKLKDKLADLMNRTKGS
jgi:hypothetical protein